MKKYFLHNGSETIGPFDIEELKEQQISRTTEVWFEGLEDWKNAEDIEELKLLFISIPPPLKAVVNPPKINTTIPKDTANTILGFRKKNLFIAIGVMVVLLFIILKLTQSYRQEKIKRENNATGIYNEQVKIQNEEIAKQKEIIAEQERLEEERIERERKIVIEKRIKLIINEINIAQEELRKANIKLVDVSGFKFLRTAGEREEAINFAKEEISIWENEIMKLNKEMLRLNPE